MAVLEIFEIWDRDGTIDLQWRRTYKRKFWALVDSTDDGPVILRGALADPAFNIKIGLGTAYKTASEFDLGSFAQQIACRCFVDDGMTWEIEVSYGPYDPTQFPQNPLDWPLRISWGYAGYQKIADFDTSGNPIVNSAGEPFIEPIKVDDSRPILTITRNEVPFDPAWADTYKDALNQDVFFGRNPYTWKCADIKANGPIYNQDAGGFYYEVTYEFHYNPDTWIEKVVDNGTRQLDSTGKLKPIYKDNAPISDPVFLDGSGKELAAGATPVVLDFNVYKEVEYAQLNLDPAGQPGQ